MNELIQPFEAFHCIEKNWPIRKIQHVSLLSAANCILAEPIYLDRDQPPFDRVMMDGYALRTEDWNLGTRTFFVSGVQSAGEPAHCLEKPGACIEIMTGAVLPQNCNLVIPYEKSQRQEDAVTFKDLEIKPFLNVHRKGTDRKKNECILNSGTSIGAVEIGILAAVGVHQVPIFSPIQIAVISTGSELVQVNETPLDFQIRSTNKESLTVLFESHGARVTQYHMEDNEKSLNEFVQEQKNCFDIICFTGGVSMGKFDFLPQVLANQNAEILFHGIRQKPGKPMLAAKQGDTLILGLPGNPVSAIHCGARYILPFLNSNMKTVELNHEVQNDSNLVHYKPVKLNHCKASIIHQNGSGDFMGLLGMDGFIEIPEKTKIKAGSTVPFFSLYQQK